jgi:hypothetical protein
MVLLSLWNIGYLDPPLFTGIGVMQDVFGGFELVPHRAIVGQSEQRDSLVGFVGYTRDLGNSSSHEALGY